MDSRNSKSSQCVRNDSQRSFSPKATTPRDSDHQRTCEYLEYTIGISWESAKIFTIRAEVSLRENTGEKYTTCGVNRDDLKYALRGMTKRRSCKIFPRSVRFGWWKSVGKYTIARVLVRYFDRANVIPDDNGRCGIEALSRPASIYQRRSFLDRQLTWQARPASSAKRADNFAIARRRSATITTGEST